jgi:hypothetical protein
MNTWERRAKLKPPTDEDILAVSCSTCKADRGQWCVYVKDSSRSLGGAGQRGGFHEDRRFRAVVRLRKHDYNKFRRRTAQVFADTARYNEERRQLAEWVAGAQLYVWFREYGSILWEINEDHPTDS